MNIYCYCCENAPKDRCVSANRGVLVSDSPSLDLLDQQIVALLHRDGRMAYTEMARRLDVAEATVRKRVSRLLDEGIVQVIGVVEPMHLGHSVTAIVGVRTEGREVDEIVAEVRTWDEVRYAAACAGTYDFILEVVVGSNEELYDFLTRRLRATPGVVGSDTSLVMKTVKQRHEWKGAMEQDKVG